MVKRVVFIGGQTNGKVVLDYLLAHQEVDVPLVVTHKKKSNVARYVDLSLYPSCRQVDINFGVNSYVGQILEVRPDFIFVAGWSEILSKTLLSIPLRGTIGFHPSKLPYDRGRSVLAWQIEEGYTRIDLSMFYYNEIPDGGDLIAQHPINIGPNDYISDVLDKVDSTSLVLMKSHFGALLKGTAPRIKQEQHLASYRRLRSDKDSQILWELNAETIYNKIRAISKPYPGAIGQIDNKSYRIWRAEPLSRPAYPMLKNPGDWTMLSESNEIIVRCSDRCIRIVEYDAI
jgi:methionyl-tRNA formyltransferase